MHRLNPNQLEKIAYPAASFSLMGENLRILTSNESAYVPPVRVKNSPHIYPIVVPTRRNVRSNQRNIRRIMKLALSRDDTIIIFLCSGHARKEDLNELAKEFPNLQWIGIDGPFAHDHALQNFETTYSPLSYGGEKDIAQKRNFSLQLARHMGWEMLLFLDDDIVISHYHLHKVQHLLRNKNVSVVGFNTRRFPDNSVAVQAHRWVHGLVDSFIGTGVMAIKVNTPFLSFFPHIYNEDWLFTLPYRLLDKDNLVWAGSAHQARFNPYKYSERAEIEEAGDIIGESLSKLVMALCSDGKRFANLEEVMKHIIPLADETFWSTEINNRLDFLYGLDEALHHKKNHPLRRYQARRSLKRSIERILGNEGRGGITGQDLVTWTQSWSRDLQRWNATPVVAPQPNLEVAMKILGLHNEFINCIDQQWLALWRQEERPAEETIPNATASLNRYSGQTAHTRSSLVLQKLWMTESVEQYLKDKSLNLRNLVASARAIRFDRPNRTITTIKPMRTISMIIANGESVAKVRDSVRNCIQWVQHGEPAQLILWVYSDQPSLAQHQLERYRNRLVTHVIHSLIGTNIQLRSSIVAQDKQDISMVVDSILDDITYAYWKCNIPADHPIYVVNSHNEILRLGTFGQFVHQEHWMPHGSLRKHLETGKRRRRAPSLISSEEDTKSMHSARTQFQRRPRWHISNVPLGFSPTSRMRQRMKQARLHWVQLDDLAYDTHYHASNGEDSLVPLQRIICIPVLFDKDLPSNKQTLARQIIRTFKKLTKPSVGYMIVIQGHANDSWRQLELYSSELMEVLKQLAGPETVLLSFNYCLANGQDERYLKRVAFAVTQYVFWLQKDDSHLSLAWQPELIRKRIVL